MKRTLLFGALLLCLGLSSCQCADPPPVGPVDDDEAHVLPPALPTDAAPLRAV